MLEAYNQAHEEKLKEIDMLNWYLGQYFSDALLCTIGNSSWFQEKGSRLNEYPKQPYLFEIKNKNSNPNSNEEIGVYEMKQRTKLLKDSGMQESPM